MMSRRGELSYKELLLALDLLPLTFDREVKDLVYLYKALFGYVNVDVSNCVSFVSHGRTRLSNTSKYILQSQICGTSTFQSSYTIIVSSANCGTLYVKMYVWTLSSSLVLVSLVLLILFMMLTCHVRAIGPCFVTVRVIGRKL